jgi:hypothetical protein
MLFFKKRKEEETEEEGDGLTPKKFRLKNKPKKEVFKPWGKKERMIVFMALFVSVLLSIGFFISSHKINVPSFPSLSFEKTIILTPDSN